MVCLTHLQKFWPQKADKMATNVIQIFYVYNKTNKLQSRVTQNFVCLVEKFHTILTSMFFTIIVAACTFGAPRSKAVKTSTLIGTDPPRLTKTDPPDAQGLNGFEGRNRM